MCNQCHEKKMSGNYSPSFGTEDSLTFGTALLSQRDLGIGAPINFITEPGVSLSAACFPFNRYEDDNLGDCLSNLLAVGFRRFEVDLYWDQGRNVWSFCPVAIPNSIQTANSTSQETQTTQITSGGSPIPTTESRTIQSAALEARQDSTSLSKSSPGNAAPTTRGQGLPIVVPYSNDPNNPLVSIGPYTCTTSTDVSTFKSQIMDYMDKTDDTIAAHLIYIYINIHAAASAESPLLSPATPTSLPDGDSLLGSIFSSNQLSDQLYTPHNLAGNRENVNDSWYTVSERYRPANGFYNVTLNEYNQATTEDGWPSASYIEFSKRKRLLLGWDTVDPQMAGYNFSADADTIFPSGFIQNLANVTSSSSGITSGCFLQDNTDNVEVWNANSSWADIPSIPGFDYPTTSTADLTHLLNVTTNLTSCGISPMLNFTLLNVTAGQDFHPYQAYSYATIWSWAYDEPKSSPNTNYRCALTSPDRHGRWIVADCSQRYYAACRALDQPYNWTTSSYTVPYYAGNESCPSGYSFAAPRTALENSFLTQAMEEANRGDTWVDFNALDVDACWVIGGLGTECPYKSDSWDQDYIQKRVILVPTIAAVIVLVVTALTIFVKAAGNRKTKKRTRKRAVNGFVYEGVPS